MCGKAGKRHCRGGRALPSSSVVHISQKCLQSSVDKVNLSLPSSLSANRGSMEEAQRRRRPGEGGRDCSLSRISPSSSSATATARRRPTDRPAPLSLPRPRPSTQEPNGGEEEKREERDDVWISLLLSSPNPRPQFTFVEDRFLEREREREPGQMTKTWARGRGGGRGGPLRERMWKEVRKKRQKKKALNQKSGGRERGLIAEEGMGAGWIAPATKTEGG